MEAVGAVAFDLRRSPPRVMAGAASPHWGPSVFTSDDGGKSWNEPEGGAIRFPASTGAALAAVWQLQPGATAEPDVVWAGVEPAALFRSADGGATFSLMCTDTADPAGIYFGTRTGEVYVALDGEDRWNPVAQHLPDVLSLRAATLT